MKTAFILFISLAISSIGLSQDEIIGKWLSAEKDGITTIYKSNGKYYGKITWVKDPLDDNGKPIVDKENPDESKQKQPIVGLVIFKNAVYEDGEWVDGTIYDPNEGSTYDCTLWMEGEKLMLRGYWGWFFRTEEWTRVK